MKHGQKCEQIREQFLDGLSADAKAHLDECAECSRAWIAYEQTMKTLDAWTAPEPSPYFQTRLRARLEEIKAEEAARAHGFLAVLRHQWMGIPVWRPAAVVTLAIALVFGLNLADMTGVNGGSTNQTVANQSQQPVRGSAVGDLQVLESHQDAISDMDVLDDLPIDGAAANNAQNQI